MPGAALTQFVPRHRLTARAGGSTLWIEMTIIPKKDRRRSGGARGIGAGETASDTALRTRGLRLTNPRRVVLEVVRGTQSHPTAAAVHRAVRRRLPRVSLGTVYRNLRLLVAEALVKELPGPHARFDGNLAEHHHFTCLTCGRIADVAGPVTEPHSRALRARVAAEGGFSVTHHRIEFYGRCAACRAGRGHGRPSRARARRWTRPTP
jgi:Fur family transcriptional regulator, peroxide stress response regulator